MRAVILTLFAIILAYGPGRAEAQCSPCKGDFDGDGHVLVNELVIAINNSLNGCPPGSQRFVDNGNGTIIDNKTGLTWEKKSNDGSLHDQNTQYSWNDAHSTFLAGLNAGGGFAGHTDWRLPNVTELQSLLDYGGKIPATNPAFNEACGPGSEACTILECSCTQSDFYWSETAYQDPSLPGFVWNVSFNFGRVDYFDKTLPAFYVRAVRGG